MTTTTSETSAQAKTDSLFHWWFYHWVEALKQHASKATPRQFNTYLCMRLHHSSTITEGSKYMHILQCSSKIPWIPGGVRRVTGETGALIGAQARPAAGWVRPQTSPRPLMVLAFSVTMQDCLPPTFVWFCKMLSIFPAEYSHKNIKTLKIKSTIRI